MKVLVTGGCSFSECISDWIDTWPRHLARHLPGYQHISTAQSGQGNGLISRRIINQVAELLKTHSAEDILVGIMWSGPSRHEYHNGNDWVILNHQWTHEPAKTYYKHFYTNTGSLILSYENILKTQWFLQLNKINYFMTTYTGEVFPERDIGIPATKDLYSQIDFTRFLPVEGEYEWCRDCSGLDFPNANDNHPGTEQHKKFTNEVIIPFLNI